MQLMILFVFSVWLTMAGAIFNGQLAADNQFRYQVLLDIIGKGNRVVRCGGAFISTNWVLTAAHCFNVTDIQQVTVSFGGVDSENLKHWKSIGLEDVHCNRTFKGNEWKFRDLCLLNVEKLSLDPEEFDVLPLPTDHQMIPKAGDVITASGWGQVDNSLTGSRFLRFVELTVGNNSCCLPAVIPDQWFCARIVENRKTGYGDSGGALVFNGIHVGIVSQTVVGNDTQFTALLYPRTSFHLDWICSISGLGCPE